MNEDGFYWVHFEGCPIEIMRWDCETNRWYDTFENDFMPVNPDLKVLSEKLQEPK